MLDCSTYAAGLTELADGLWVSSTQSSVSYPEEGNDLCYQVEDGSFWFRHRNRCIASVVRNHPPAGPLFDVGGGNGFVSLGLREAGFQCVLVEPHLAGAKHALERGVKPVIAASFDDVGFYPASLPAAGLFDVLEHVPDDVGLLRRLRYALIPRGRLYLTVPAYSALWSVEDDTAGHQRRYTLSSLGTALRAAGFAVDYATYMFAWLPLPVFLRRTLPSRLGRRSAAIEAQRTVGEHSLPSSSVGRLLNRLLQAEHGRIALGKSLPVGGSCLVAAHVSHVSNG